MIGTEFCYFLRLFAPKVGTAFGWVGKPGLDQTAPGRGFSWESPAAFGENQFVADLKKRAVFRLTTTPQPSAKLTKSQVDDVSGTELDVSASTT